MVKTFLISDTHFWHYNIIRYCNRPFVTVEEMNESLINNWNNVVSPNDIVWHLGDFSSGTLAQIKEIFNRLNGQINLLIGNHDKRRSNSPDYWKNIGFNEVVRHRKQISDYIVFSHQPISPAILEQEYDCNTINIHGHLHDQVRHYLDHRYINVSVENTEYAPTLFINTNNTSRGQVIE